MKKNQSRFITLSGCRTAKILPAILAMALTMLTSQVQAGAASIAEAITSGEAYADLRLRYETVEQDNALEDATALTLRTRLGYSTGSYQGFSALVEFEDSRIVAGQDDFSVPPTGFNPGKYSVIADPETTELDQAYLQYKNDFMKAKFGPQVITLDNQRFVGHVGWRQDRVTYDAVSVQFTPIDKLKVTAAHIFERNRLLAEVGDQKSKDNLINIAYPTKLGKVAGYAYLLEDDFGQNAVRDTYGVRFSGATKLADTKVLYTIEYADQSLENDAGLDISTDYLFVEAGAVIAGVTAKLAYEKLGSDDGQSGFFTPLATVHKFNGWSDQFVLGTPAQGLVDIYASASTKLGPGKLTVVYHDFSADEDSPTVDDFGSEINIAYGMKFGKHYNAGIKYADYSAGDAATNKVDTEKVWFWVGLSI